MSERLQLVEMEFEQLEVNAPFFLPPESGFGDTKMEKIDDEHYQAADGGGPEYHAGKHKKVFVASR